jgi:hypothetical protein
MAHVITETPTFTPTITVPDGTDSRVNAAEVVAAIAQGLANRAQYLKLNGVFVDVVNTLVQGLVIANPSVTQPSIDITTNAQDGSAAWKLILRAEIGNGAKRLRLYTGTDTAQPRAILTTNAFWNGSAWALDDSAAAATALGLSANSNLGLQVWRKQSASAPWTSWDGAGVTAESLTATGNVTSDQYLYNAFVSRTITLNTPSSNTKAPEETGDTVKLIPGDWVNFSIPVPHGAIMKTVKIKFSTAGGFYRARIFRKKNINMSDGSVPFNEEIATTGIVVGDPTTFNISLDYGDIVASSLEAYSVSILNDGGSANNMFIYVAQFTYAQSVLTNAGSF